MLRSYNSYWSMRPMRLLTFLTLKLVQPLRVWNLAAPPPIVSMTGALLTLDFPPFPSDRRTLSLWLGHMTVPCWSVGVPLDHPPFLSCVHLLPFVSLFRSRRVTLLPPL